MTHSVHFSSVPLASGSIFANKYRLRRQLGEGGMGSVWEADHLFLGTTVALKLVGPGMAKSPEVLSRFSREAQATAALRSEYVVQVFDHDVFQGQPYLVLERLKGETLAERLARLGRLDVEQTLRVLCPVAQAADLARRAGIVHRDLKPSNVFLAHDDASATGHDWRVKVLDFGVAKVRLDLAQAECKTWGTVVGTPWYMSPEQAQGLATVDHTTDLWAIAVMAYECLSGKPPFDHETLRGLLAQVCAPTRPELGATFSFAEAFNRWFQKATARDPAQRFQSGLALVEALASALQAPTTQPTMPSQDVWLQLNRSDDLDRMRSSSRRRAAATIASGVQSGQAPRRARRGAWLAAAALLLFTGAAGTWGLQVGPSDSDPSERSVARAAAAIVDANTNLPSRALAVAVAPEVNVVRSAAALEPDASAEPVVAEPALASAPEPRASAANATLSASSTDCIPPSKRTAVGSARSQPTRPVVAKAKIVSSRGEQAQSRHEGGAVSRVAVGEGSTRRIVALPGGGLITGGTKQSRVVSLTPGAPVAHASRAARSKEIDLGI
jgi:serine/threonine protein kinase